MSKFNSFISEKVTNLKSALFHRQNQTATDFNNYSELEKNENLTTNLCHFPHSEDYEKESYSN